MPITSRLSTPSSPRFVHDLLDNNIENDADRIALADSGGTITYASLSTLSRQIAVDLRRSGVSMGDRVLCVMENSVFLAATIVAASRIGAIFVVVNPQTPATRLELVVNDCHPAIIVVDDFRADDINLPASQVMMASSFGNGSERLDTSPALLDTDLVALIYTSGSTMAPRGVIVTHQNVMFSAGAIQARLQILRSDGLISFLPMSFDYGLYQVFLSFLAGCALVLRTPTDVGPGILGTIAETRSTVLPLMPTIAEVIVRLTNRDVATIETIRAITSTGARMPETLVHSLRQIFPRGSFYSMFGLTECKRVSIMLPSEYPTRPRSVGRPLDGTRCFVVDKNGQGLPPGHIGELVVCGPHVTRGYWNDREATEQRFRRHGLCDDVALFTGDLCSMDGDGFIFHHGRADDIFKIRGYRVSATEIESAAIGLQGVFAAALVHATHGGPVLFVLSTNPPSEVRDELAGILERYKIPSTIRALDDFPKTANGKVDKNALAKMIE